MARIKPTETGPIAKQGKRKARRKKGKKCLDKLVPWSKVAKKEADRACFPIFRGSPCFLCGSRDRTAGHHVIPRSESAYFRHNVCNLVPLCATCHCRIENSVAARTGLLVAIDKASRVWWNWLVWACQEKFRVVKEGVKPDFVAAAAWWECHEVSELTVEESRRVMLEQWNKERTNGETETA